MGIGWQTRVPVPKLGEAAVPSLLLVVAVLHLRKRTWNWRKDASGRLLPVSQCEKVNAQQRASVAPCCRLRGDRRKCLLQEVVPSANLTVFWTKQCAVAVKLPTV